MPFNSNAARLPQWLVLMKGYPGIGKSTLARALSRHLCWPLVGKDHMRHAQQSIGLIHPGPYDPNGHIGEALYDLAYEITWTIAEEQLGVGLSVIIDSPLTHEQLFLRAQTIASRFKAFLGVVEINMDTEEHKQRLKLRASSPDLRPKRFCHWEEVEMQLDRNGGSGMYNIPQAAKLVIDGSMEQNCQMEMILRWIHWRSFGTPIKSLPEATFNQIDTRSCRHLGDTLECEAQEVEEDKMSELRFVGQQKPSHVHMEEHEFYGLSMKRESSPFLQSSNYFNINSEVSSTTATSRANTPPREESRFMIPLPRFCAFTGSDVSSTITTSRAISPEHQVMHEQTKVARTPIPVQAELAYCDMNPPPSMRERMLGKLNTSRNGGSTGLELSLSRRAPQSALVSHNRLRQRSQSPPEPQLPQLSNHRLKQRSQSPPEPQLPQLGAPPNKVDLGGAAQAHVRKKGPELKVIEMDGADTEDDMPPLQPVCQRSASSSAIRLDAENEFALWSAHDTSSAVGVKDDNEFLEDRPTGRQVWRGRTPEPTQVMTHGQPQQIARSSRSVSWAPDSRKPRNSGIDVGLDTGHNSSSSSSKNIADAGDAGTSSSRGISSSKKSLERRGGLRGSRASVVPAPVQPSSDRTHADETPRGNTPLSARRSSGAIHASPQEDTPTPSLRRRCALRGSRAAVATTPRDRGEADEAAGGSSTLREGRTVWTSRVAAEETRACMPPNARRVILSRHASASPDDTGSRVWKSPGSIQSSRTARPATSPSNHRSETYIRGSLDTAHVTSSEAIKKGRSSSGSGPSFKHSSLRGAKDSKPTSNTTAAPRVLPTATQYRRQPSCT